MTEKHQINLELLKPLDETRYLTADNAARYRVIMRFFYEQHQKLRYWMHKEDIFNYINQFEVFNDYTVEKCEQDLNSLVQWKNLISTQDTTKAATIEEFKNKKFRYQLSPYSIEIERMTIKLESLTGYGGSLEPSLFERVYNGLTKLNDMVNESETTVGRWWQDLNNDFESIYHNATDYIASLQSVNAEELMQTDAFIIYKDRLIDYLRDFIKDLQRFSSAIEDFLRNVENILVNRTLHKVVQYEMNIPRIDKTPEEEEIWGNIKSRWDNLSGWFLGYGGEESEAYRLLNATSEIIRKITRFAARIAENQNRSINRKADYIKLAAAFSKCDELDTACKFSAAVFGPFNTRHLLGDFERTTESITCGVWEEKPTIFTIKPKVRNYSQTGSNRAIVDRGKDKDLKRQEILKNRRAEERIINDLIRDNRIVLGDLPEIEPFVRTTLLRWIAKAMVTRDRVGRTEDGRNYKVIFPKFGERIWLSCKDGNINMPAFIIEFGDVG